MTCDTLHFSLRPLFIGLKNICSLCFKFLSDINITGEKKYTSKLVRKKRSTLSASMDASYSFQNNEDLSSFLG
jgi:hypothetical protein